MIWYKMYLKKSQNYDKIHRVYFFRDFDSGIVRDNYYSR